MSTVQPNSLFRMD